MKLLREPLVHFIALGAALFAIDGLLADPEVRSDPSARRIVIDTGVVERLVSTFRATWGRPPDPDEVAGLLDDHITEEVLYREALAMGLERDDPIIRRRLRQKMEFISEDLFPTAAPTDAELSRFLEENAESFWSDGEVSFHQVFVESERRGAEAARAEVEAVILRLGEHGADPQVSGDATLLPQRMAGARLGEIAGRFGPEFATRILAIEPGKWTRVASTFGEHAVLVESRVEGKLPALDEIRDRVAEEWRTTARLRHREETIRALRASYEVVDDLPEPASAGGAGAGGSRR